MYGTVFYFHDFKLIINIILKWIWKGNFKERGVEGITYHGCHVVEKFKFTILTILTITIVLFLVRWVKILMHGDQRIKLSKEQIQMMIK